jgi:NADPH-dependent 2,4-dienoyl-CoA reductase/sulfur reductase-like enzyme
MGWEFDLKNSYLSGNYLDFRIEAGEKKYSAPSLMWEETMTDYLIIGADAAGLSAAVQIKRLHPQASLKVINKGRFISYGACGIPYVISREIDSAGKLIHFTPESFQAQRGIGVEIQKEATAIFPQDHAVEVKNLETGETYREAYGKLLIATGAQPHRLKFLDYGQEGIFNLHDIEDLNRILDFLQEYQPKTAALIGAGNIGLELTEALHGRGVKILLFDVLDSPAATWPVPVRRTVSDKLAEKGVLFKGKTAVLSVQKKGGEFILETEKENYRADLIFSLVGTKPATDFCENKLEKMKNGAIVIDRCGCTSDNDIYAAGDCASVYHQILDRNVYFPLGSTANKMGRIAGMSMAGSSVQFPGIVGTQIFKFFELSLAKTGLSLEEARAEGKEAEAFSAAQPDKAGYYPGAEKAFVEIIIEKRKQIILGASAVCFGNAAQFIDPVAVALSSGMTVSDLAWFDFAYAPPYAPVWNALLSSALKAAKI